MSEISSAGVGSPASRCRLYGPGDGEDETPRWAGPVVTSPRSRAGFQMQIIRPGRWRGRNAAVGVAGRDQPEFARGGAVQQPRRQHALIDDRELLGLDALGGEKLRAT